MSEVVFVSYIPDIYGVGAAKFVTCSSDRQTQRVVLGELIELKATLVVQDANQFVEECRRAGSGCPRLIDLSAALKLYHGVSRDQGGEALWNSWRALAPWCNRPNDIHELSRVVEGRQALDDAEEGFRLLELASVALADLWADLQVKLRDAGEHDRFWSVEAPIQNIFYQRQYVGIAVDAARVATLISGANEEKYASYLKVARALNKSPSGIHYRNIGGMLAGTDAEFLSEFSDANNIEDYFRIAAESSDFAASFVSYMRSSRDVNTLVQLTGDSERVFPTFSTLGTVSGRVLVRDPFIQELKKRYRGAISADPGHRLSYLDYGQFEPGILASMSSDNHLIEMYNSADLYDSLALSVFKSEGKRPLAKRMFLAFCYGMSRENIAKLVAGPNSSEEERTVIERRVSDFFETFSALPAYRQKQQGELYKLGRVHSLMGNRRVRTDIGELTSKENRWALSQAVQGTASLIFKEAMIDIEGEFGNSAIVLPMHDAVLLQFSDDDGYNAKCEAAAGLMRAALTRRCPELIPKVVIGTFAEEA